MATAFAIRRALWRNPVYNPDIHRMESPMQRHFLLPVACALGLLASPLHAAETAAPALPTAEISVESSRSAPNDQFRAQVYYEASDANPAELARKVS